MNGGGRVLLDFMRALSPATSGEARVQNLGFATVFLVGTIAFGTGMHKEWHSSED